MRVLRAALELLKSAFYLLVELERYLIGHMKQGLITVASVIFVIFAILTIPDMHQYYIGVYSGSKTVLVWDMHPNSQLQMGGTGFHVKAPSGRTYLITNRHVCEDSVDGQHMSVTYNESEFRVKILKTVQEDICVLEPIPGVRGFRTASTWQGWGKIYTVGFPGLHDYVYHEGYRMALKAATHSIRILHDGETTDHWSKRFDSSIKEKHCNWPNQTREWFRDDSVTPPERVEMCQTTLPIIRTTMRAVGGASGSPVMNKFGQIIGIVAIRYNKLLLSGAIPVEYINKALENM